MMTAPKLKPIDVKMMLLAISWAVYVGHKILKNMKVYLILL